MKEQDIQRQVLDYLTVKAKSGGLWFSKVHTGPIKTKHGHAKNPMRGFPDILCCYRGRMLCFEMKTEEAGRYERQKDQAQVEMRDDLRKAGALVTKATSVEQVAAFFAQVDAWKGGA